MNAETPLFTICLNELSNDDLLTHTRRLVGCSNQILAALLAHLGEVDARGIYRERSCASLYTYCIYELRMPEDMASRRAQAARFARKFGADRGGCRRRAAPDRSVTARSAFDG